MTETDYVQEVSQEDVALPVNAPRVEKVPKQVRQPCFFWGKVPKNVETCGQLAIQLTRFMELERQIPEKLADL
jgi:hypothetical protein